MNDSFLLCTVFRDREAQLAEVIAVFRLTGRVKTDVSGCIIHRKISSLTIDDFFDAREGRSTNTQALITSMLVTWCCARAIRPRAYSFSISKEPAKTIMKTQPSYGDGGNTNNSEDGGLMADHR